MSQETYTTSPSLLLQLRNRNDSLTWSRFVRLYTPLLDHWTAQLGFSEADRADVIQDVFILLLGKISSFQYDASQTFRGWLRTITLNKCRDRARRSKRQSEPQFLDRIEQAVEDDTTWLTQKEYCDHLVKSAMQLMRLYFSEQTWRACWEHVANGRPAKEVAEELKMSVNAVYLARGRVLARLRQELEGLWED